MCFYCFIMCNGLVRILVQIKLNGLNNLLWTKSYKSSLDLESQNLITKNIRH